MRLEESLLLCNSILHRYLVNDIFLGSVLDTNVSESQRYLLVHKHLLCVCTAIHNVDLRNDTDSTHTSFINFASHLQAVRVGDIRVGRNNTEDNSAGVTHVAMAHSASDLLDVFRLVTDSDTCDTGQIDEGQVRTSVGEDLKHNWFVNDVFVSTTDLISKPVNVVAHLTEVSKLLPRNLVWEDTVRFDRLVYVIETQFKRSSGYHTITSGEEVETDDGLED